jgi:hypothetical protein
MISGAMIDKPGAKSNQKNLPNFLRSLPSVQIMKKLEWGNVPQWVSAICALALAFLAIYGLFFSTTSQALVAYLQSELAVRNQHIAALELRERELQLSVANAQSNLNGLADQKTLLEKQVALLNTEQESLTQKVKDLGSTLSKTEFSLVKEKIGAKLSSTIGSTLFLREDELYKPEGVRARSERPWDGQLSYIREIAEGLLPERDRPLARNVVVNFARQCERYSKIIIQIPALKIPKDADFSAYDFNRDKHPISLRLTALNKQLEKVGKDIEDCFHSVTP